MIDYIFLESFWGFALQCCAYTLSAASNLCTVMYRAKKTPTQFKLLGKRVENIEGINLKGLKNSLEKVLAYAHIVVGVDAPLLYRRFIPLEK